MDMFETKLFWLGPTYLKGLHEIPHGYLIAGSLVGTILIASLFLAFWIGDRRGKKNGLK